jgi:hypothetical protein
MRTSTALRLSAAVSAGLLAAAPSLAECQRLVAANDPAAANAFVLDFGPFGGTRTANITYAEVTLEVCDFTGEARFLDYYQEAGELILPDGTSTGDLTILIRDSQSVFYGPATGMFETSDIYQIHFAGDLSAYQISSPFELPDNSRGIVAFETATDGTIGMEWTGDSALPNPFVPGEYIPFSYACSVNLRFATDPGCGGGSSCDPGDVNGDCTVGLDDLADVLANFGARGPRVRPADGDTNRDLTVNLTDLANLLGQFGNDCN